MVLSDGIIHWHATVVVGMSHFLARASRYTVKQYHSNVGACLTQTSHAVTMGTAYFYTQL